MAMQQTKTLKTNLKKIGAVDWVTGNAPRVRTDKQGKAKTVVKDLTADQAEALREALPTVKIHDNRYTDSTHVEL